MKATLSPRPLLAPPTSSRLDEASLGRYSTIANPPPPEDCLLEEMNVATFLKRKFENWH